MKKISIISIIIIILLMIGNIVCLSDCKKYSNLEFEEIAINLTNADSIEFLYQEDLRIAKLHYNNRISYFVVSTDYCQPIGYCGITTLGIIFDSEIQIEEVRIIASEDTRSFVRRLKTKRFLNQFIAYKEGDKCETVTGATISSKAVIKSVKKTAEKVMNLLGESK